MKSSKISYLWEFPKFLKKISELNNIIFFFPFYHFGGGETVHLDILKFFKKYGTSCFIAHESENDFLKDQFYEATQIIELSEYKSSKYDSYLKSLAKVINSKTHPVVFGCNNRFFYKLIEYLDENRVKIIDLTHAFSYEDPHALEKFSLPIAHKIHKRVVLGEKTYLDYKELYASKHINLDLLKRFVIIPNSVEIPKTFIKKPDNEILKILFVSRNSFEKRPEVFFEIAKRCFTRKINASFKVIGDFENVENTIPNLEIIGSIKEKETLNDYYLESDILLITSFREGLPMVIIEGMAYGVVPVSTNVGEISSLINSENNNGILLNDISLERYSKIKPTFGKNKKWYPANKLTGTPKDLEKIIEEFILTIENVNKNRELLKELSVNAYKSVKKEFSKKAQEKSYLDIFFKR